MSKERYAPGDLIQADLPGSITHYVIVSGEHHLVQEHCRHHYVITPEGTIVDACDPYMWARRVRYGNAA